MSYSLWLHGLQNKRLPCPLTTPGACSNSYLSSWWCHPTISSSVMSFSFSFQSFPASGSFPMNQFFASCGPSIGASTSASFLPMTIQSWFPLGLTGLTSLHPRDSWNWFVTIRREKPKVWDTAQFVRAIKTLPYGIKSQKHLIWL